MPKYRTVKKKKRSLICGKILASVDARILPYTVKFLAATALRMFCKLKMVLFYSAVEIISMLVSNYENMTQTEIFLNIFFMSHFIDLLIEKY